jgi:hypothetical protein
MLIKVLKNLWTKNKDNQAGREEFKVTQKRFEEINSTAFGILVEEVIPVIEPEMDFVNLIQIRKKLKKNWK